MPSWCFRNIGFSCESKDNILLKQLLECCGITFGIIDESEAGIVNTNIFHPSFIGTKSNELDIDANEIFQIANTLFNNVYIFSEFEEGNSISDYYYRYEEIFNPNDKNNYIGEVNYDIGVGTIFYKSIYNYLRDEIEQQARKRNIKIQWDIDDTGDIYISDEASEDFCDLCQEIVDEDDIYYKFGKKKEIKKIRKKKIKESLIQKISDKAGLLGYDEICDLIDKEYGIHAKKINKIEGQQQNLYTDSEIKEAFEQFSTISNNIVHELYIPYESRYKGKYLEAAEKVNVGDILTINKIDFIENMHVYDWTVAVKKDDVIIGFFYAPGMGKLLDANKIKVTAFVDSVIPLSERKRGSKKPIINIKFTYEKNE